MGRRIRDDDRSWRRHEIAKRIEDIRTGAKENLKTAQSLVTKIESVMPMFAQVMMAKELPPRARTRRRKALEGSEAGK